MEQMRAHPSNTQPVTNTSNTARHILWRYFTTPATTLIVIASLAFILYDSGPFHRIWGNRALPSETVSLPLSPTFTPPTPTPDLLFGSYQNWHTYDDDTLGIQFQYPGGWGVYGPYQQSVDVPGFIADLTIDDKAKHTQYNDIAIKASLFSGHSDIAEYIKQKYIKEKSIHIYSGVLSTSPYLITEYILITDVNTLPDDLQTYYKWLRATSTVYYITIERSDKSGFLFENISATPRIFYDVARSFQFTQ